jgi:hypothetical protein
MTLKGLFAVLGENEDVILYLSAETAITNDFCEYFCYRSILFRLNENRIYAVF